MQKTIKNLAAAFIGESQARNRYSIYSKIAKNEGYEQISAIFAETAEQEQEHAKWLMRLIGELKQNSPAEYAEIMLEAGCPTIIGTTAENLKAAMAGENHEQTSMYPEFAAIAKEEGLDAIAARLLSIAKAEKHHEERYQKLLTELENGTLFKKNEERSWICRKCGYEHTGNSAPETCPACGHPQSYYQLKQENY
jgi:rubrerythrin